MKFKSKLSDIPYPDYLDLLIEVNIAQYKFNELIKLGNIINKTVKQC